MGFFDKKTKPTVAATAKEKPAKSSVKKADTAEKTVKAVAPVVETAVVAGEQGVYGVLISPLITEKSTKDEQHGKYVFAVVPEASKSEIIKAVMTRYGVKPAKVNVLNRMGKVKRFGKTFGKRKDWRKAVITLPKGKSINVYEAGK